jgi:hypothetical protein
MATGRVGDKTGVTWSGLDLNEFKKSLLLMADTEVLVGVPESEADRTSDEEGAPPINNATIGYISEYGMPEKNIPERPWLIPSIRRGGKRLSAALLVAGKGAAKGGGSERVEALFSQVGMLAVSIVRKYIQEGIDPPLSERTLIARSLRVKGGRKGSIRELKERAEGNAPSTEFAKPLIDTGNFIKSINYVVVSKRSK